MICFLKSIIMHIFKASFLLSYKTQEHNDYDIGDKIYLNYFEKCYCQVYTTF